MRLRDQQLSVRGVSVPAGARDGPAGEGPKRDSHQQAAGQRNDRHTIHGHDLARAQRQNLGGRSAQQPSVLIGRAPGVAG